MASCHTLKSRYEPATILCLRTQSWQAGSKEHKCSRYTEAWRSAHCVVRNGREVRRLTPEVCLYATKSEASGKRSLLLERALESISSIRISSQFLAMASSLTRR